MLFQAKCEQYWPEFSKKTKYGYFIVENIEETVLNYYTIRLMEITRNNETRKAYFYFYRFFKLYFFLIVTFYIIYFKFQITHLHYTAWPDHGIPLHAYSIVSFMQKMLSISTEKNPVIVHCSAGVGRTGTLILLDICLHQAANKGVTTFFSIIYFTFDKFKSNDGSGGSTPDFQAGGSGFDS